jgi:cell division protein ZapA (FtsZ GTPase activity inhibitor)
MEKSSLEVDILGSSFTVQSSGDPQHLERVIDYLRNKVEEIRKKYAENTTQDPVKISLLAGLNVADELLRGQRISDQGRDSIEVERITERLIDTIDRSLTED